MVEGQMKCIKYLLFGFNLLFFICGLALIIVGAVVQLRFSEYVNFLGGAVSGPCILLIAIGVIIFLISFFGCYGAIKENYCLVISFSVLLVIVFILEIAAGIAGFVCRDQLEKIATDGIRKGMSNYGVKGHEGVDKAWNAMQLQFHCCGVESYTDWVKVPISNKTDVPDSCCLKPSVGCGKDQLSQPTSIEKNGCLKSVEENLKSNILIVAGIGTGFAFIQLIGIIYACLLARAIRQGYDKV